MKKPFKAIKYPCDKCYEKVNVWYIEMVPEICEVICRKCKTFIWLEPTAHIPSELILPKHSTGPTLF